MSADKKHVLIVGTVRACHDRLLSMGIEVSLFIQKSKVLMGDTEKKFKNIVVYDDSTTDATMVALARGLHAQYPFDAIASFADRHQIFANLLSCELGLPLIIESSLINKTRNKKLMREALLAESLPTCRFDVASDYDGLIKAVLAVGLPCIIKPMSGEGSRDVRKISRTDEVESICAEFTAETIAAGLIIEQYLDGDEYSVEAISDSHEHYILAITKKFKDSRNFVEIGHVVPAPLDDVTKKTITDYVRSVLDALGFHNSASHTELIFTADGPRIVETHTRVGGDKIVDLVRLTTGIDLYELVAKQAIGESIGSPQTSKTEIPAAAVWYAAEESLEAQVVSEIHGLDEARRLPHVREVDVLKKVGSRGGQIKDSFDRSAVAVAVGNDAEAAVANARDAALQLRFLYRWDPLSN